MLAQQHGRQAHGRRLRREMSSVPVLRTLVRLRQRRVDDLASALTLGRQQLRQQVHALDQVLGEEARLRDLEQAQRDKLLDTSGRTQGFRASDIVTLQHLLGDAQQRTAAAGKQVQKTEQQVEAARQQVQAAQQALRRAEHRLERQRQLLQQALDRAVQLQEDQQDDEAEEAAVARLLAAARVQAQETLHG
jgi:flagellar biosynthesis chaperone FliJ